MTATVGDNDPTDEGDAVSAAEKTANPDDCDDNGDDANQDSPDSFHGTLTAGVAAANSNNTVGIAGVAWAVKILPVRAIGKCGGSLVDMADAIRWSAGLSVAGVPDNPAANVAKVIYVGAGTLPGVACGPTLQNAIDAAINAGSVVIAATGNHGRTQHKFARQLQRGYRRYRSRNQRRKHDVREHRSQWWRWAQPDDQRSRWRVAGVARRTGPNR